MYLIEARNVNRAYFKGLQLLNDKGNLTNTRAGRALVMDAPVMTVYEFPRERVLFDPYRDANPFFHLMEALWMLAGRNDARFLDQFVSDFSARFAEDDGKQHGAYGFRWRTHFELEGGSLPIDQLATAISLLKTNPGDRRVVISMWDPMTDLGAEKRDIPCNTHIYTRIRTVGEPLPAAVDFVDITDNYLDITVCCRSNDAIWGAYGANAVHFSILHEYLAAMIGVKVGKYYQLSNNFHVYTNVLRGKWPVFLVYDYYSILGGIDRVPPIIPLVTDPATFDNELTALLASNNGVETKFNNTFLSKVVVPLWTAHQLWRGRKREAAIEKVNAMVDCDWKVAAAQWFARRMSKAKGQADVHSG